MKILLLTDHSHQSEHLAAISRNNQWEYSAKHGYDFLTVRREWADALKAPFGPVMELLPHYDAILSIGSDVLFTNFDIRVEDILQPDDNIVVAVEPYNWPSYFNLGVMLICNTQPSMDLMKLVTDEEPNWRNLRLILQDWMNANYKHPVLQKALRFVPTRVMNSPDHGTEKWQPGDWLIHFCGHKQSEKPSIMREFLAIAT